LPSLSRTCGACCLRSSCRVVLTVAARRAQPGRNRRNQQTLEELQRPVYEEPEEPRLQRPSVPSAPAAKLVIFLRDATGDKQKFIIKTDTKFEVVFDAYCAAKALRRDAVRFAFDGDAVSPGATPAALEMDDDDVIDVKRL